MASPGTLGVLALVALILLVFTASYLWSVVWCFFDARRQGKSGLLVALFVALAFWPLGLIVWLVVRPEDRFPGWSLVNVRRPRSAQAANRTAA